MPDPATEQSRAHAQQICCFGNGQIFLIPAFASVITLLMLTRDAEFTSAHRVITTIRRYLGYYESRGSRSSHRAWHRAEQRRNMGRFWRRERRVHARPTRPRWSDVELIAVDRDQSSLRSLRSAMKRQFPGTDLQLINADFRQEPSLPSLDGIIAANAVHYRRRSDIVAASVAELPQAGRAAGDRRVPTPTTAIAGCHTRSPSPRSSAWRRQRDAPFPNLLGVRRSRSWVGSTPPWPDENPVRS